MSSLRGLTHILTCEQDAKTPFTIIIPASGPPQIHSSIKIKPGEKGLCGGLTLDTRVGAAGPGRVRMSIAITNNTDVKWRGTVQLLLPGEFSLPVDIGEIDPHQTESDELDLNLPTGSHEIEGSLLLGP